MLDKINLQNVLFLDIETVPEVYEYAALSTEMQELWDKKMQYFKKENSTAEDLYSRAGIYAEFGKIVCISVGYLEVQNKETTFQIQSFFGADEFQLLTDFTAFLTNRYGKKSFLLCAHNGKEFDFPYMARRMLIQGIKLPSALDLAGKKPWEVPHLDTLEMWKFGDYKNFTSLNLLAAIFKITTPKDDIDGSQVAKVFWEEKNVMRIVRYCQKDVLTVAQLLLRFTGKPLIAESSVFVAA